MAWRGVHVTRPGRLSFADNQLVVDQEDGAVRLPLEDVAWVVLDDPRITLTHTLLGACMEQGVAILCSDSRHMPSGMLLPFHRHHRQAAVAQSQLSVSQPFKKRLWQKIVCTKIENQARVLEAFSGVESAEGVRAWIKRVTSGDSQNSEAHAARAYWRALFRNFVRDDGADKRNKMLNYGYAVVRGGLARALVASGLLPCFGVHHASQTNPFNLADDLIEPFRPILDAKVRALSGVERSENNDLTVADRRQLASVLLESARMGHEQQTLLAATEACAASLVWAMETGDIKALVLPQYEPELGGNL
jgi:CRISP-associated protein Cas1